MWRLPQTKAPYSPPHSSCLSLHMVTGRPARGNYTHSPVCEVSQRPQSPLTRSRLTPYHMLSVQTHLHVHANSLSPLSSSNLPLPPSLPPPRSLTLARSEIITHFEWLWKVYSFFKSNKNNRVTIMLSDVAVSFHCKSPSSRLCLGDTATQMHPHVSLLYMKHIRNGDETHWNLQRHGLPAFLYI